MDIRVCIVDDNEDDYLIIKRHLNNIKWHSFSISWGKNFEDGIRIIEQDKHDIYLVDYKLGKTSGIDLISEAIENGCENPFVILTSHATRELDLKSMDAGAINFLEKGNLNSAILEHTIRYAINQKKTENRINEYAKEREILFNELKHRVKNNFMTIDSLFTLNEKRMRNEDDVAIFRECKSRISTMAILHKQLYMSDDISHINANIYFKNIIDLLAEQYSDESDIKINKDIESMTLEIKEAIPIAMIINEVITNSFKYAFNKRKEGNILFSFKKIEDVIELKIQDDGDGFSDDFDERREKSLGYELIHSFANQLNAIFEYIDDNGVTFILRKPISNY